LPTSKLKLSIRLTSDCLSPRQATSHIFTR